MRPLANWRAILEESRFHGNLPNTDPFEPLGERIGLNASFADHPLRDGQPCRLPDRAVSGALERSVDGPHGSITASQPRVPA